MVRRIDQLKAESSTVFTGTYLYKWSVAMLQYFVKVQVLAIIQWERREYSELYRNKGTRGYSDGVGI